MIGIDIVCISRIQAFEQKFGTKALTRFLHQSEIAFCLRERGFNYARIAGFWSAKEALSKALGCGIGRELSFLDMYVKLDSKGAPHIYLSEVKQTYFQAHKHFSHIALSITHDVDLAIACVMLT